MKKHSENAMFLAEKFENDGLKVKYPGLKSHKNHELMKSMMHEEYGFGGLLTLDVEP
jgi:methionine-gamma-lyase